MPKLTLTSFLTLDGVMQAPGGPREDPSGNFQHGGWLVPQFSSDMGLVMLDIFSRASAFLMGRGTYDIFSVHWPRITDPSDLVAAKFNSLPKFVASNSQSRFDWAHTRHVADIVRDIESIKNQLDGELQVHGSCGLAQTLIEHNLIEEYRLFIIPVALGTGKRLFNSFSSPHGLKLMGARSMANGVTYNVYRPTQEFRTGSFHLD
jgi:dihydrofolate reductase